MSAAVLPLVARAADVLLAVYVQLDELWDLADEVYGHTEPATLARRAAVRLVDALADVVGSLYTDERDAQAQLARRAQKANAGLVNARDTRGTQ
jgi:hypothetical protein